MVGSDPIDSMGTLGGTRGEETGEAATDATGWGLVAEHDGAGALVQAILQLDEATEHTKSELSDAAGVAYKTLYLDETVEALVDVGLLERVQREGEETAFRADATSSVYEAAAAFDEAAADYQQTDSS